MLSVGPKFLLAGKGGLNLIYSEPLERFLGSHQVCFARPLAEILNTAGRVRFEDLDERLMLREFPGMFCAGEYWIGKP